jgi:hypothetical protein
MRHSSKKGSPRGGVQNYYKEIWWFFFYCIRVRIPKGKAERTMEGRGEEEREEGGRKEGGDTPPNDFNNSLALSIASGTGTICVNKFVPVPHLATTTSELSICTGLLYLLG